MLCVYIVYTIYYVRITLDFDSWKKLIKHPQGSHLHQYYFLYLYTYSIRHITF